MQEKDMAEYRKFYTEISKKYKIKSTAVPDLSQFYIFQSNYAPHVYQGIRVFNRNGSNCALHIVEFENRPYQNYYLEFSEYYSGKYLFGRLLLKQDWGDAIIKPESLSDKIRELFKKEEIDFESHKMFSFKYYVLAKDPAKFRRKMTTEILNFLQGTKGLTIEFRNR